jgi:hypothetical protein
MEPRSFLYRDIAAVVVRRLIPSLKCRRIFTIICWEVVVGMFLLPSIFGPAIVRASRTISLSLIIRLSLRNRRSTKSWHFINSGQLTSQLFLFGNCFRLSHRETSTHGISIEERGECPTQQIAGQIDNGSWLSNGAKMIAHVACDNNSLAPTRLSKSAYLAQQIWKQTIESVRLNEKPIATARGGRNERANHLPT